MWYLDTERHEIWHSASGKHTRHYSCLAHSGDIECLFLGTTTGDVAVVLMKNRVVQHFLLCLQGMRDEHGFDSFSDSSLARGRCPSLSSEKQVRIVLAIAARVGPNTQDRADDVVATTGHHLEDMMATCHQPGVAGEVAETSLLRQRNTYIVAREACEGPNTPGQARRLMAETGHHLKIISFTWYSGEKIIQRFQQVWKEYGVILTGATSAVCS